MASTICGRSWFLTWLLAAYVPLASGGDVTKVSPIPTSKVTNAGSQVLEKREIRAQLMPRRYTTIAAEIGAKVNHLPIPEGGRFKMGTRLLGFDCSLQQAQLNKSRAALIGAEKTWNANRRLYELNSVGKVELDISEAEVAKAKAEVASNGALISKCTVVAPYSGRVAEQRVREQQYVQPGQVLLEILDDSSLELDFIVPSKWLSWLRPNYSFQVAIDETAKSYPARVQSIGARVDPVSQSIKLTATIDGKFNDLIAGMSGRVLLAPPPTQ
ncbi:MAG: efflux RND transporter periplasmic adaptor subunit [Deltaproteobacteria bacterium]|nr:efflux RND transporter periplasmic adaptor subunit [Deltaproteobacteria bacterium]